MGVQYGNGEVADDKSKCSADVGLGVRIRHSSSDRSATTKAVRYRFVHCGSDETRGGSDGAILSTSKPENHENKKEGSKDVAHGNRTAKRLRKFRVSRAFCTRMEWIVEAFNEEGALAMMDDNEKTPDDECSEEWLGPVLGWDLGELEDRVEEL